MICAAPLRRGSLSPAPTSTPCGRRWDMRPSSPRSVMTGAVNARSKRQQEKWRFESAVANESTDLLLTLGDSDDAEKKTAASTITKVVSWNDAWVSTFGDYAKTATRQGRQDGRRRSLDLADRHAQSRRRSDPSHGRRHAHDRRPEGLSSPQRPFSRSSPSARVWPST